ncbi:hypothetical protein DKT77_10080 [Meridianimarinicoccus roseus]|jgi:hypothetical protein|uniref:Uncharacterized protein n=1 Tax=Meridianimarinicoccus roseus TaxID=2072018 RepID=A0A2V2LKS3_9RHOB|nr:hypothetical protein [Meridianimarinicoccus roseus]PWR02909.1 hypothetical protein DKT77_10080 [Meridianimarinicoccus roseus]
MPKTFFAAIAVSAALLAGNAMADDTTKIAELQVVMQRYIDSKLIDGAMRAVDYETGEIRSYYPTEAHTMVMGLNGDYVLCSDLTNKDGTSVPVDFYITETPAGYVVYQTEINNRAPLQSLIKQGLVERIR